VIAPGDLVDGRYAVGARLGRGGMGEVYRALDTQAVSTVALKVLTSTAPGSDRRFRAEADLLGRLAHPGIVAMHGAGVHEGVPYLVLDLADGPSLADQLHGGRLGVERTVDVGAQLADALGHAHDRGVTHRDVKPSNILFDSERRLRLADFGIARVADGPALTTTGELVGSAPYLAPEQVSGQDVGPPADVYALGLVLAECLTGHPCFAGNGIAAALSRLHRPPDLPEEPAWLHEALGAMTARMPARRPPVEAVAATLRSRGAVPVAATTAPHTAAPAAGALGDPDATAAPPTRVQPAVEGPSPAPVAVLGAGAGRRPAPRPQRGAPDRNTLGAMAAAVVAVVVIALAVGWARGDSTDEAPAEVGATTATSTTTTASPATATPPASPPTTAPRPTTVRTPAAPATPPAGREKDAGPPPEADTGRGNGNGKGQDSGNGGGRGKGRDR
jgi:hypothetical protein